MSLHETAQAGDELTTLRALRDVLAGHLDAAEPQHVAALSARLDAVLARITSLEKSSATTEEDETPLARVLRLVSEAKPAGGSEAR